MTQDLGHAAAVQPEKPESVTDGPARPQLGSVVYLKSGSVPLTVAEPIRSATEAATIVDVEWFVGTEVRRDSFHKNCLTIRPLTESGASN